MTKDEALEVLDQAAAELEAVKARHEDELAAAKAAFAKARDAFIDASRIDQQKVQTNGL